MGIVSLWNILSQMSKGLNRADYLNKKTVAIDISGLLYSYYYTSSDDDRRTYHVRATFIIITRIFSLGLMPVFVFDSGAPHHLKTEELERRRHAENNMIRNTPRESEQIDLAEYKRIEAESLNDIMKHFSSLQTYHTPQSPSLKAEQELYATEYRFDNFKESISCSTNPIIKCHTCHDITPIIFNQSDAILTIPSLINQTTVPKSKEDVNIGSSDSLEFGADYNYEGTKLLLSHKLHFNSENTFSQLEEYANWQLSRRLIVSQINEQVFTTIRQQRDSARLALLATVSPLKQINQVTIGIRPSVTKHSVFDISADSERYFTNLEISNEHDKQSFIDNDLSAIFSSMKLATSSVDPGWYENSSNLFTLQEMDAINVWSHSLNNRPHMLKSMGTRTAVGTTFSSFVNQPNQFPEIGVFKRGVYSTHKKRTSAYSSSLYKPLTDRVITEVLQIATLFKVPCIKCKPGYEAEHVCALLNSHGYVAAVLTEDSDVIAYRPVLVLRLFGSLSTIHDVSGFQSIHQKDVYLYFSDNDIMFLALVMGCDFCDGIPSFGYVHTLELLLYLKYLAITDAVESDFQNITIHKLIDRFRLYMSFNSLIVHPNSAVSQMKNHTDVILCIHETSIKQNWEKIAAYKSQPCFSTYFPDNYQPQTFLRELAQLRFLLNRRLWFRRDLILRKLQKTAFPDLSNVDRSRAIFKEFTSKWNSVINLFSREVPIEETCSPMFAGGRSLKSLMQSVNSFSQQHIIQHLDTLIEGSDSYKQRTSEELQRLTGLSPCSIQACLQKTTTSFIKNREDINRVRITELLSASSRRGNIFDFQSLGKRTFQSMRALFTLKIIYS